jgi:signal transduction histidine kinase
MNKFRQQIENMLTEFQCTQDIRDVLRTFSNYIEKKFPGSLAAILEVISGPFPFIQITSSPFTEKLINEINDPGFSKIVKKKPPVIFKNYHLYPFYDELDSTRFILAITGMTRECEQVLQNVLSPLQRLLRILFSHHSALSKIRQDGEINILGHIIHDVNSFITSVREQKQVTDETMQKTSYMDRMNHDLLFLMRDLEFVPVKIKPTQLFKAILSNIHIKGDITFSSNIEETEHILPVDVELLEIAIQKIIENSVRSVSLHGHKIQFETQTIRSHLQSDHTFWLKVSICDNGPGIPNDFIRQVKRPFFTTFKNQGHAGLGLPIAEKIISAHKGILNLTNLPDGGTRVEILLPLEEVK